MFLAHLSVLCLTIDSIPRGLYPRTPEKACESSVPCPLGAESPGLGVGMCPLAKAESQSSPGSKGVVSSSSVTYADR